MLYRIVDVREEVHWKRKRWVNCIIREIGPLSNHGGLYGGYFKIIADNDSDHLTSISDVKYWLEKMILEPLEERTE